MMTDYIEALRIKAEGLSLGAIVEIATKEAKRAGLQIKIHSKGTWSRLLNGKQVPTYEHLVEIAVLCGLPLPETPPLIAAEAVKEWHRIGKDPPKFGLLLSKPGNVRFTENPTEATVTVRVVRGRTGPEKGTRRKRGLLISLDDIKPVEARFLGRGKSGSTDAIRAAAKLAAYQLEVDHGKSTPVHLDCRHSPCSWLP